MPSRVTSYVPVRGATIVIANLPAPVLKKTSPSVSTPTFGSSVGAKDARATMSHGGNGGGGGEGGDGGGEGGGGDGGGGVMLSCLASAQSSRFLSQSVFTPA